MRRRIVWIVLLIMAGVWSAHVVHEAIERPERLSSPGYLLLVFLAVDFLATCLVALILGVIVLPCLVGLAVGMVSFGRMLRRLVSARRDRSRSTPPSDSGSSH